MESHSILKKRYSILWIPVLYHKNIQPLNCHNDSGNEDDNYSQYRKYKILKDVNGKEFVDTKDIIRLEKVPIADGAYPEVYLSLILHKSEEAITDTTTQPENENKDTNLAGGGDLLSCPPIEKRSVTVEVVSYDDKGQEIFKQELFLKCIEASYNGLFQYEYEYNPNPDKPYFLLDSNFDIIHAVYHAIKGLYHKHEYHDHGADSITNPFCSGENISIKKPDNPALLHYLKLFENMFLVDVGLLKRVESEIDPKYKNLKKEYRQLEKERDELGKRDDIDESIKEQIVSIKQKQSKLLIELQKHLTTYRHIDQKYAKIRGKQIYYQSLFYSKYNTLFKPYNDKLNLDDKEFEYSHRTKGAPENKVDEGNITLKFENNFTKEQKSAYKSAINIQNALNRVAHRKKEIENFIDKETHFCNGELIKLVASIASQTNSTADSIRQIATQTNLTAGSIQQIATQTHTTTESIQELTSKINETTGTLEILSQKANKAEKKSRCFNICSTIAAFVITFILAGGDYYYYKHSASDTDVKQIKTNQTSIEQSIKENKTRMEELDTKIMELKGLLIELTPDSTSTPVKSLK